MKSVAKVTEWFSLETRRAAVWAVLVLALVIIVSIVPGIVGYRPLSIRGTSMEPALHDGDALLVKLVDAAEVKVGDIVALEHYSGKWVVHRVVRIEPLPQGDFLFQSKGDANQSPEWQEVDAEKKVAVVCVRIPSFGLILEFIKTIPGLVVLVVDAMALVVVLTLLMRTHQAKLIGENKK